MGIQDDYLLADYPRDEADLRRAKRLAGEAISTLSFAIEGDSKIPYTLPRRGDKESISWSTNAMVLHALTAACGAIGRGNSVIFPWGVERDVFSQPASGLNRLRGAGKSDEATQCDRVAELTERLEGRSQHLTDDQSARDGKFRSDTWGDNNPLTLTYVNELYLGVPAKDEAFRSGLKKATHESLWRLQDTPASPLDFADHQKGFTNHSFSLLRLIHLFKLAEQQKLPLPEIKVDTVPVLTDKIHRQLSLSGIEGEAFDAGELVYPLEALLQLNANWYDRDLVDRIFGVLESTQAGNAYWRPFSPISVTEKGLVLLPQSIEVAKSLLRTCNLVEARSEARPFSEHSGLFRRYAQWLFDRALPLKCTPQGGDVAARKADSVDVLGWESEHTHQRDVIHTWLTSQVLLFTLGYAAKLREHIARSALTAARLTVSFPRKDDRASAHAESPEFDRAALTSFLASEPVRLESGQTLPAYHLLAQGLRLRSPGDPNRWTSVILYGPPGTGKSTTAKEIAQILGWPMVRVTPGDFASTGGEGLESRAQVIFKTLGLLSKHVVFFDEMDQLMLDRESELYRNQSDVFKLVTPSMLTKMADLVDNKDNVYLIATNYFDRVDRAVSRPGRIDARIPILPPDTSARRYFLGCEIDQGFKPEPKLPDDSGQLLEILEWQPEGADPTQLSKLLSLTPLFSFAELRALVDEAKSQPGKEGDASSNVSRVIGVCVSILERGRKPTISVSAYETRATALSHGTPDGRAGTAQLRVRARLECALVAYLYAEAGTTAAQKSSEGEVKLFGARRAEWEAVRNWLLPVLERALKERDVDGEAGAVLGRLVTSLKGLAGSSGRPEALAGEELKAMEALQRALQVAITRSSESN